MKSFLVFLFVIAVIAVLYFGFIQVIQKTMRTAPPPPDTSETSLEIQRQKDKARDLWEQQKRLMETRKYQMQDIQKR